MNNVLFAKPGYKTWVTYPLTKEQEKDLDILAELQGLVEGYIETVMLTEKYILIVNENGKNDQLPYNELATELIILQTELGDAIFGTAVIVKAEDEDLAFLTDEEVAEVRKEFRLE